jgi:hypothetical protein
MPDDDRPAPSVGPRFARSAQLWLRAYPRRWRAARAAELTEVLADLAEPGATRLGLRDAVDVVRSGWATRWREHPPARPFFAFRLWDRRLPAEYDPWLRDDVTGAMYPVRKMWPVIIFVGVMVMDNGPWPGIVAMATWATVVFVFRGWVRREALARYFPPAPPRALVFGPSGFRHVPRVRYAARPLLGATALIGLTTAAALLTACAFATPGLHEPGFTLLGSTGSLEVPQRGYPTGLLVALGVGGAALVALATAGALRGVVRRAAGRPSQPHRVLVGGGRTVRRSAAATVAVTAVVGVLIATDLWLDVTGVVAGTIGAATGGAALVGWLVVRRAEHDGGAPLAIRDVRHLAGRRRRRPLEVDPLVAVWTWPDPYALPTASGGAPAE